MVLGCDHRTFLTLVLREPLSSWNNDIDRRISNRTLERLAAATGQSTGDISQMTLEFLLKTLHPQKSEAGLGWILPLGHHRNCRKTVPLGQYCPLCLSEDSTPYFRKYWRLAFFSFCPTHHRILASGCPRCGATIRPSARNFEGGAGNVPGLAICPKCQADLRLNASKQVRVFRTKRLAPYFDLLLSVAKPATIEPLSKPVPLERVYAEVRSYLGPSSKYLHHSWSGSREFTPLERFGIVAQSLARFVDGEIGLLPQPSLARPRYRRRKAPAAATAPGTQLGLESRLSWQ